MDVLLANEITPSMIVSNNAPERLSGQVEWDADGPSSNGWPAGSVVTRTSTRRVYRAVYDVPAGGVPPEDNIAVARLPFWVDAGPMNQWAMFDKAMKTQTIGPPNDDLVIVLHPGITTDIWLGNISGATAAHVVVKDKPGGAVVYDETRDLSKPVTNFWDWWFAPFELDTEKPFTGIPAYRQCEVTITLSSVSGAALGMAALGKTERWGCTEWGVNADFQRYTPVQSNQAWGPTQQGGEITKDVTYRVFVEPEDAPRVDRSAKDAMKRLAVYLPSRKPEFAGIRIFGEMINARMGYPGPNYVPFDITVREFL